jgi:hypothetical protein
MQIARFETSINNDTIPIPIKYKSIIPQKTRIIVKIESMNRRSAFTQNKFEAVKIKTKGFKFNRDEANER